MPIADRRPAITDLLDFSDDPDRAVLAQGDVAVTVDGVRKRGSGDARIDLVPHPRVVLDCEFDAPSPLVNVLTNPGMVPYVEFDGRRIAVVGSGGRWGSDGVLRAKWSPASQPVQALGDDGAEMRVVRACLFNLGIVHDTYLSHGHWSVAIQTHDDTLANQRAIREQGVYRATHIVSVSQADGGSFRGDEARKVLEALRNFLSFANGGPCNLVCPSGFDENGELVWSQWSSPYGPERVAFCWSGRQLGEPLVALFPGFMAKWEDEEWRDALGTAVWWYTASNGGGAIDSGIVSTQIAMERLAYEYREQESESISKRAFKKMSAADKLRMLLGGLAIPLDIGPPLDALASASDDRGWGDAADALAAIRNHLVHSGKRRSALPQACYIDAWLLATWLLEASVLALCDFQGECWNRITKQKERAPG